MTLDSPITFVKDPNAKLDYSVDWTLWLAPDSDTLASCSWSVPAGLSLVAQSNTTKVSTVWLASGTAGQAYDITNHIQTAAGRIDERTFTVLVRNK